MRIVLGDLTDPRVVDLLHVHLATARAETAPGSAHALDLAGLRSPDIRFWAIREEGTLAGYVPDPIRVFMSLELCES
jgi:putative acetyltransferase